MSANCAVLECVGSGIAEQATYILLAAFNLDTIIAAVLLVRCRPFESEP
jgi:hypothetical protein